MEQGILLCVDDEIIVLTALKDQLRRAFGGKLVIEVAESAEEALDLLLPAIRNRFDVESVGRGDEASRRVPSAPVAGHLAVLVAIDREHSISMVSDAQVAEWGVSFDGLLERAVANLESRSPCRFERHEGGFFVSGRKRWKSYLRSTLNNCRKSHYTGIDYSEAGALFGSLSLIKPRIHSSW